MARPWKVLFFRDVPWVVGERELDRDARVKTHASVKLEDCYPGSYTGQVISVIPASKEYSEGDLKDPSRAVVTLMLTVAERTKLASRECRIKAGKVAPVTFDERQGRLAAVLRANFDDPEAAELEAEEPLADPQAFELTDGWRFAELVALNMKLLPKTVLKATEIAGGEIK